jgi:hypothetical protein
VNTARSSVLLGETREKLDGLLEPKEFLTLKRGVRKAAGNSL